MVRSMRDPTCKLGIEKRIDNVGIVVEDLTAPQT